MHFHLYIRHFDLVQSTLALFEHINFKGYMGHTHFNSKEAVEHVAEMQAKGIFESTEIHGTEIPGHLSAFADTIKETVVCLVILSTFLTPILPPQMILKIFIIFSTSWLTWKIGRSAWLGWSRLERLHRIVAQEKWEIDHHREQEKEELTALYRAKGFDGKLLEDVIDTLMADGNRLLKVMVEEELGLSLETHEHPLKQSLGAALGVLLAAICCIGTFAFFSLKALLIVGLLLITFASFISSYYEKNRYTPAILWNIAIAALSYSTTYYLTLWIFE